VFEFETSSDIPAGGVVRLFFPNERVFQDTGSVQCKMGDAETSESCTPSFLNNVAGEKYLKSVEITGLCVVQCPAGVFKVLVTGGIKNPLFVKELTVDTNWAVQTASGSLIVN
jgi:hypothetical protein